METEVNQKILEQLRNQLIVSCQALEKEPLHGPMLMAAMARAAKMGGAGGIRTNGLQEVEVCRAITGLPIIGIFKETDDEGGLAITPTFERAEALVQAGADVVAVDVRHSRPFGEPLETLLPRIRQELRVPVMADCETDRDADRAIRIGVDIVSSTFGFRQDAYGICPDFSLLEYLVSLPVPIIAEGGFWHPEQVKRAFDLGAHAVVVGSAITRPLEITRRFAQAVPAQEA